jgi:hypothetical protein
MRKSVLFVVAISAAALAVASPAMAGKLQFFPNTIVLSNGVSQGGAQHQKHINAGSNPFQIGSNTAILTGFGPGSHGSQTIDQTQRGHANQVFWWANTQVNLASNFEIFSFDGNDQSIKQDQHAHIFLAFGNAQFESANNVVAFGSGNDQSIDQSQKLHAGITFGSTQVQTATNVVVFGDDNTQKITQSQDEHAGVALGTNQVQTAANVVVGGDNNDQTISQSQSTGGGFVAGPRDTQAASNVVLGGSNNTQSVTQDQ